MLNNTIWFGTVENNNDPEYRGRVQVRVFGAHDVYSNAASISDKYTGRGIPTEDLPWAICSFPVTYGGTANSTCPPPQVQPGAWVHGISLDGDMYNELIVLGVLSSKNTMSDFALNPNQVGSSAVGNNMPQQRANGNTIPTNPITGPSVKFSELLQAVIYAESSNNPMANVGSYITSYWGLCQVHPVNAAKMILQGSSDVNSQLVAAGYELNDNMRTMFTAMASAGSSWRNVDGAYDWAVKVMQIPEFNKAVGSTELRTWANIAHDDPVVAVLYYNQGSGTTSRGQGGGAIVRYCGGTKAVPIPEGMTYTEFVNKAANGPIIGNNPLGIYIPNIINRLGGLSKFDEYGRVKIEYS
jgi:hypothetical protein